MAHRDTAAPAVFLGLATDVFGLHALGRVAHVQMHVDVHVPFARDREDAVDLPARVGVDVGHRADHSGTAAQAFDQ